MAGNEPQFLYSFLLDGRGGGKSLDFSAISNWSPAHGKIWLHFDVSEPNACRWLEQDSGLPLDAIDTLLAGETRPRSSITPSGLLVVLRGVNTNPGEDPEDMVSVRLWVDGDRVISSRRRRLLSVTDINEAILAGNGPETPGQLLAMLTERLADRIGNFVDSIEDRLDSAEDEIGTGDLSMFRPKLSALRRQVASVRRFLAPQRDALDRLNRQPVAALDEEDAHHLRQEADRITRYLEDLDLARERAIVLQEELLSQIAQQQNARMYVLSVVAAVFLPLTFVTGLLGMNVGGLPGLESPWGFYGSVAIMGIVTAVLVVYFRWKKWL
ncbi:MAG: zinc transporter ZntB [Woeseiaceae bacterium]|nr:zinc transporter ZntB [Woeseiaceae bacterium]